MTYTWQREGWQPFFIRAVVDIDRDFHKITGTMRDESLSFYIQRLVKHPRHHDLLSQRSLAQLKDTSHTTYQLSVLLFGGMPLTVEAFVLLADAREARVQRLNTQKKPAAAGQAKALSVPVDTAKAFSPLLTEHDEACIRMVEMTHELHVLGYQKIRIFPYLSPSSCHWRLAWAPAECFVSPNSPPRGAGGRLVARYTSASGWAPFGWEGVQDLSAHDLAQQFIRQFPELARAGQGQDWPYAGWLSSLLGEVRNGRFPCLFSNGEIELSRGFPMSRGGPFPLPPALPATQTSDD
ncbi:hypothetical protein LMK08_00110 [Metapseudomonas furukawaii]|uniref:hypothetical protein n=1 Tax=Metapseudomonas furukawaii TaxID=1149133 RepID=UPI00227D6E93|nr:hypothetical protein [Pseudomonas furukawaii]WAG79108.1 hypothetical protein LMK08_00110 [Pseudomonas furukawaii]